MLKNKAQVGMKVVFGTPSGEKTLGEIVKLNFQKAKVKILESRGSRRVSTEGSIWSVPYSMMEPAVNEQKSDIPSTKNEGIIPGTTTFVAPYADSNSLWKVISQRGHDVWLCKIIPHPDEEYTDWVGTQKVFLTAEILGSIGVQKFFLDSQKAQDNFYANLTLGTILHYHNVGDNWVRCEVVTDEKNNKVLLPIALVGDWKSWDLPRRNRDGSVYYGYHAQQILDKKTFTPNNENIWECNNFEKRGYKNPQTMTPINFEPTPLTPEETRVADMWKKIFNIQEITQLNKSPEEILNDIRNVL